MCDESYQINYLTSGLKRSHNISHGKDRHMGVQVGFHIVTSLLCIIYWVFRVFIFIENLIGLGAWPPSA
jgi:hypothetical protein